MGFTVQYPLFVISKDDDAALVKGTNESAKADALAVFTDEDAALAFRDEHFSGWRLAAFPDEPSFARLLTALQERVFLVAIDPYRVGTRMATIPLKVLLEQLND